ncbi:MAG: Holliday junction branch migration protein RuvA [bacterium]|nr:Holliday junction branch migration protein RuvA [bacterium]
MIGSLTGVISHHIGGAVLLEVGGIGYLVAVPARIQPSLQVGTEAHLFIYDHVREDARRLFGFTSLDERHFFETLISISGVGPKVALLILSVGTIDDIRKAVESGDVGFLTSVPGIGAKTAKKIVLELKGKLVEDAEESTSDREVVDALVALGYSSSHAREAVRLIDVTIVDTEERIRIALKMLSS